MGTVDEICVFQEALNCGRSSSFYKATMLEADKAHLIQGANRTLDLSLCQRPKVLVSHIADRAQGCVPP
jgi:hypothetical protein